MARTASLNAEGSEKVMEEKPRVFAARRSRPGHLSRSELLFLFHRGLCFKCRKPGHIAANGPYASLAAMFLNRVSHFDCVINRGS